MVGVMQVAGFNQVVDARRLRMLGVLGLLAGYCDGAGILLARAHIERTDDGATALHVHALVPA